MDATPPPLTDFGLAQAEEILRIHWGRTGPLKPLTSYEDRNFALLDGAGEPSHVLRVQNVGDPLRLGLEARVLKSCQAWRRSCCPRPAGKTGWKYPVRMGVCISRA